MLQAVIKHETNIPEGFDGVILRGHTIINIDNKSPPMFDYLREKVTVESGGGRTNTGEAVICTDLKGRPLRNPSQLTYGEGKLATAHAYVSTLYIEIKLARKGNIVGIDINKVTVAFPPEIELLWQYDDEEEYAALPEHLEFLQDAVDTAITKSKCWHCKELHFYGDGC